MLIPVSMLIPVNTIDNTRAIVYNVDVLSERREGQRKRAATVAAVRPRENP